MIIAKSVDLHCCLNCYEQLFEVKQVHSQKSVTTVTPCGDTLILQFQSVIFVSFVNSDKALLLITLILAKIF